VALTFLEKTREKVKSSDEAVILCKTAIGALKLNIGDLQVTKETIEDVEEMLNNLPGVTSVHSRFYDLSSKYYQTVGNHAAYYKDALRFLGCVDIKDLPGNTEPRKSTSKEHALEAWSQVSEVTLLYPSLTEESPGGRGWEEPCKHQFLPGSAFSI